MGHACFDRGTVAQCKPQVKVKSSWKDSMMRLCERRHRRYVELFGENPSPPPQDAWVKDNELFICHATRQVFTTTGIASRCIALQGIGEGALMGLARLS